MKFPINLEVVRRSIYTFLGTSLILVIVAIETPNNFSNFLTKKPWLEFILVTAYFVIVSTLAVRLLISYTGKKPSVYFDELSLKLPTFYLGMIEIDSGDIYSVERMLFGTKIVGISIGVKNRGRIICSKGLFQKESDFLTFIDKLEDWVDSGLGTLHSSSLSNIALRQQNKHTFSTYTLAILFVCFYAITLISNTLFGSGDQFLFMGVGSKNWLIDHEYYRVASSTFLHAGYVHLMLNLFVLGVLGSALERVISAIRFINIFLVASLSGYFAFYFLSSYNFGTGASGGLFGLWGAYFALRLKYEEYLPGSVNTISMRHLGLILVFEVVLELFLLERVAFLVHLAGFISGCGYLSLMTVGNKVENVHKPKNIEKYIFTLLVSFYGVSLTYFLSRYYGVI